MHVLLFLTGKGNEWLKNDHVNSESKHPRLATLFLLRAVVNNFGCHLGLKCSSMCKMNVGTSRRSACASIGYEPYPSVSLGNLLLERTGSRYITCVKSYYICIRQIRVNKPVVLYHFKLQLLGIQYYNCLGSQSVYLDMFILRGWRCPLHPRSCLLIALATCLGGVWSLEQPSGAVTDFYPAFRETIKNIFSCGGQTAVRAPLYRYTSNLLKEKELKPTESLGILNHTSVGSLACGT